MEHSKQSSAGYFHWINCDAENEAISSKIGRKKVENSYIYYFAASHRYVNSLLIYSKPLAGGLCVCPI